MGEESARPDPVYYYGHWSWIVGILASLGLVALMFALSNPAH